MRNVSRLFFVLLLLAASQHAASEPAKDDGVGVGAVDTASGVVDLQETDMDALRRKAETEGEWALSKDEQVAVDQGILTRPWRKVPFDQRPFDYSAEQLRENWETLMNAWQVPYMSAKELRGVYERYPEFARQHAGFNGDFDKLERDLNEVMRRFVRGDFQEAMQLGMKAGPFGMTWGKAAQVFQAVYLEPDVTQKHMLLQDVANHIRQFGPTFDKMKKSSNPFDRKTYVLSRLTYIYSIGRIAEDVPIPVAISRNYIFKVMGAVNDVRDLAPDNPLGIAARAGVDANVVRKVGKATGRVTFGAKQADVRADFERALARTDLAVIRYEYGNALLYLNKRRDIDEALKQLKQAASTAPTMAIEALDAMYAAKRSHEIEALAASSTSFRAFERNRLKYQKEHNENLYCVLPDICKPFLVK